MLSVSCLGRIHKPSPCPLCKDKSLVGVELCLFGVSWVLPSSVRETLLGWHGLFVGKKHMKVWRAGPLCLFWIIWKARTRIAFKGEELSIQSLKSSFVCFLWSEAKGCIDDIPFKSFSFLDWLGLR